MDNVAFVTALFAFKEIDVWLDDGLKRRRWKNHDVRVPYRTLASSSGCSPNGGHFKRTQLCTMEFLSDVIFFYIYNVYEKGDKEQRSKNRSIREWVGKFYSRYTRIVSVQYYVRIINPMIREDSCVSTQRTIYVTLFVDKDIYKCKSCLFLNGSSNINIAKYIAMSLS